MQKVVSNNVRKAPNVLLEAQDHKIYNVQPDVIKILYNIFDIAHSKASTGMQHITKVPMKTNLADKIELVTYSTNQHKTNSKG